MGGRGSGIHRLALVLYGVWGTRRLQESPAAQTDMQPHVAPFVKVQ